MATVNVIPAIDLMDGQCVRLLRGDFDQSTIYSSEPLQVAARFSAMAVTDLHIVDLDGARTGVQTNVGFVSELASRSPIDVQVGGGIRSIEDVSGWLDAGVARCVIGSAAVTRSDEVIEWIREIGAGRLVLALDVRIDAAGTPRLATHGWTRSSGISLWECLDRYADAGLQHVLCTDIDRDGALAGPNLELYAEILRRYPGIGLQASGGVRTAADLAALQALRVPAAVTGRALLDGRISQQEVASFRQSA